MGDHYPIGGSETHISVNDYELQLTESRTHVDTVLWEIDCPNWYVVPHGKGMSCTLYIFTYLKDTVMLWAEAVNRCDTIRKGFFIRTSYYDVSEQDEPQLEVGPNPTDGMVNLSFDNVHGQVELLLYNAIGRQVDAKTVDADLCKTMSYVLPELDDGLYVLVMRCNGASVVRKILLMRR